MSIGDLKHYIENVNRRARRRRQPGAERGGQALSAAAAQGPGLTEIALDVEVAHAICQNGPSSCSRCKYSFANLKVAVNTAAARGAEVISNSYGAYGVDCAPMAAYNKVHVAITGPAGDSGFAVACPANQSTGRWPWATRRSTCNGDGSYSESVWSGTGSGCSSTNSAQDSAHGQGRDDAAAVG